MATNIVFFDIKVYSNCFIYTDYYTTTKRLSQYVVTYKKNEIHDLYEHLNHIPVQYLVGFNCENYSYPLLHYLVNSYVLFDGGNPSSTIIKIVEKSKELLEDEKYHGIPSRERYFRLLDLYLVFNFNSKFKRTSLSDAAFNMQLDGLGDTIEQHYDYITDNRLSKVLDAQKERIKAIIALYFHAVGKTKNPIYKENNLFDLREKLSKKYKINFTNAPNSRIGIEIILRKYCEATGMDIQSVRKMMNSFTPFSLNTCIPSCVDQFQRKEFIEYINILRTTNISNPDTKFNYIINFHNCAFSMGLGGIHYSIHPGIYESDCSRQIYSFDVRSMYPSIIVQNNIFPKALGKKFLEPYKDIYNTRMEIISKLTSYDVAFTEGLKQALNVIYGKMGEANSVLYDKQAQYTTSITGQVIMCLLFEHIVKYFPNIQFLLVNSDGFEVMIDTKDGEKLSQLVEEYMSKYNLNISCELYKKLVIKDVSNYIGITDLGEEILRGCFEINKELHKDSSVRIIPIALRNYFVENIPIDQTIRNHGNIYDFCIKYKNRSSRMVSHETLDKVQQLSTVTRYYISNHGGSIITKPYNSNDTQLVHEGYLSTIFNTFISKPLIDYDINYMYYKKICNNIIEPIIIKQLTLFN